MDKSVLSANQACLYREFPAKKWAAISSDLACISAMISKRAKILEVQPKNSNDVENVGTGECGERDCHVLRECHTQRAANPPRDAKTLAWSEREANRHKRIQVKRAAKREKTNSMLLNSILPLRTPSNICARCNLGPNQPTLRLSH